MNTTDTAPAAPTTTQFLSGGVHCVADFYRPAGSGPFPVIVMGHGVGGTRKMRLPAFAERFAAAGYACLVFDYRHFGDSECEPRQLLDIPHQLEDWKAAIAHARTLPGVDPERVAIWGSSFGGGHVLSTAADVPNLVAVISQCPFTDGAASSKTSEPKVSLKLAVLALRDIIGSKFGAKPLLVPLAGRPGETAFMTAPDVWDGQQRLYPPGHNFSNSVAARFAFGISRYFPGRKTHLIQAPVLFCICDPDTVAPAKQALEYAARTPRHEVKRYPYGHFEIYVDDAFEHVVRDQLDFLRRTVPVN